MYHRKHHGVRFHSTYPQHHWQEQKVFEYVEPKDQRPINTIHHDPTSKTQINYDLPENPHYISPNNIHRNLVALHDVTSEAQDLHLLCSCYHPSSPNTL
jgi:hypothetical protein